MCPSKSRRRRPRKKKSSNTKLILIVVALLVIVAVIIVAYSMLGNGSSEELIPSSNKVLFETSVGDILIKLRDDVPITVDNFKSLVQQGVYDNTIFHRVVNLPDNLVIVQGGDPTGTGYGDPSIPNIQDEFSENPDNNKNVRGTIAMANTGVENSGSSQFFINGEYNSHLDNKHPVFGDVIDGMTVIDDILDVETDSNSQPIEDIILIKASFVD